MYSVKFLAPIMVALSCVMPIRFANSMTTETSRATNSSETTTAATARDEKVFTASDVYVKVLGRSGKIVIGKKSNPDNDGMKMVVQFDSIQEKDAAGNVVGKSGRKKHSFNTFASQKFAFGTLINSNYENINAKMFNFTSTINEADLMVDVCIFTEAGNISIEGETTRVKVGNVKFNIMIKNWKFCGSGDCTQGKKEEVGKLIDFTITIKQGSGKAEEKKNSSADGEVFEFGDGGAVTLSKKVQVDDRWTNMATGYPTTIMSDKKQQFVFRFPMFNSKVWYDPVLDLGIGGKTPQSAGSCSVPCVMKTLALLFTCMLVRRVLF